MTGLPEVEPHLTEEMAEEIFGLMLGEVGFDAGKVAHAACFASMPQMARKLASSSWP